MPETQNGFIDIRKALDTSSGTTGAVLVPEIINDGIRMFVETRSPLWNLIRKVPTDGYAYAYREQNGLPVASFGAELGALPAAQNATYVERIVPIKSVYIRGELSGQLIEATRSVMDVLDREINNSALGMVRTLEQKIIAGNSSVDPNEFDGLARLITTVVDADTDAGAGTTAGPLTLAMLDTLLDAPAGGTPTCLIMSKAMLRKLKSLIHPSLRLMGTTSLQGNLDIGFNVDTYNGVPIIPLFDNASILATTILAPDLTQVFMPQLLPLTYMELPRTRDSLDYILKMYIGLAMEGAARHGAKLINVSSAIS